MAISFHKKFITLVAAASILITGVTAGQAQAGSRDTERALAAILGLAVIGAIIADNRKDDRRKQQSTSRIIKRDLDARPLPRDLQHRADRRVLPRECLRSVETRRGQARYFGRHCLRKNYRFVNRLPQSCETRIRTNRGDRIGYGARCLRDRGYTMARR